MKQMVRWQINTSARIRSWITGAAFIGVVSFLAFYPFVAAAQEDLLDELENDSALLEEPTPAEAPAATVSENESSSEETEPEAPATDNESVVQDQEPAPEDSPQEVDTPTPDPVAGEEDLLADLEEGEGAQDADFDSPASEQLKSIIGGSDAEEDVAQPEEESSLLDELEQSDVEALDAARPATGEAEAAAGGEDDPEATIADVTEGTVFRQQKVLDAAVKRLRYSREDLGNGILILRTPRGIASSPSIDGFTGLLRTISSEMADRNSFRFGGHLSFYHMGTLWDDVSQTHMEAIGFFTYSILPMLEARIAANAGGHSSGRSGRYRTDPLFQVQGDLQIGGKYTYSFLPYLSASAVADFKFYTNVERLGAKFGTFSTLILLAATVDFLEIERFNMPFPLRAHLNVGYFVDQSYKLVEDIGNLTASSYFGLGFMPGDKFILRAGLEVPKDPWAVYLEYTTDQYLKQREDEDIIKINKWGQSPQRITPGFRYNPVENIVLDMSIDISAGMARPVKFKGQLEPSNTPYQLNFGAAYEWNPRGWGVYDLRGALQGIVVDADTGEPVGGAIIEYPEMPDRSSQMAFDETGEFSSYRLPPGKIKIRIQKEEYEPRVIEYEIKIQEANEEKFFLRKKQQDVYEVGAFVGTVTDRDGRPVTATISFGSSAIEAVQANPGDGSFVKLLAPGTYQVRFEAAGYEEKIYEVPVEAQKKTRLSVQMISGEAVGALAGRVVDQDGRPLAAIVRFLDAQVDPLSADATGNFFRVLGPGTYKVEVALAGYSRRLLEIPIETGKKTTLDISLESQVSEGALAGKVLSSGNKPLAALIVFDDPNIAPVPSDPDGGAFLKILAPGTYGVTVKASGYESRRYEVPILEGKKTVQDFVLKSVHEVAKGMARIADGQILTLLPVEFEPGTKLLTEASFSVLGDIAKLILQDNVSAVSVEAHTNNLGPSDANRLLSEQRAEVIRAYLQSLGVPESKLSGIGFGEERPVAPTDTAEGRALNERIEFRLQ